MTSGLSEACPTSWSTPYLTDDLIGLIDKKEKQKKKTKNQKQMAVITLNGSNLNAALE